MVKRRQGLGDFLKDESRRTLDSSQTLVLDEANPGLHMGEGETLAPEHPESGGLKQTDLQSDTARDVKETDLQALGGEHTQLENGELEPSKVRELQSFNLTESVSQGSQTSNLPKSVTPELQILLVPELQVLEPTELPQELPLYARLQRKEVRLREEQYELLTMMARSLQRSKSQVKERITENTLIRVAIDLLLEHRESLKGETEPQLLEQLRKLAIQSR